MFFTQVASLGDFLITYKGWFNTTALKLLLCQAASFLSSLGQVKILFSSLGQVKSHSSSLSPLYLPSQLYVMDLFLGRRFLNFGSNIFNYARLRAALVKVLS